MKFHEIHVSIPVSMKRACQKRGPSIIISRLETILPGLDTYIPRLVSMLKEFVLKSSDLCSSAESLMSPELHIAESSQGRRRTGRSGGPGQVWLSRRVDFRTTDGRRSLPRSPNKTAPANPNALICVSSDFARGLTSYSCSCESTSRTAHQRRLFFWLAREVKIEPKP